MAIVTNIEERRGMMIVDADGRRLCSVKRRFFKQLPLQVDEAIDEEEYLDRLAQLQLNPCYEDALSLLDFSMRATGEMRKKLQLKGYLPPAIDAVIERLLSSGLLNDADFAERMVQQQAGKPVGFYALKRKLRAKGVDEEAAEAALENVDEDEQVAAARALAEKSLRKYGGLERREARAKISQALARRGFTWDAIGRAMEGLFDGEDE